ncbi:hypothetical protein Tco_0038365 [Tanacetum coccineum]
MQAARDRQKSYADVRRKPLEFQVAIEVIEKARDQEARRSRIPTSKYEGTPKSPDSQWEREDQFRESIHTLQQKPPPRRNFSNKSAGQRHS